MKLWVISQNERDGYDTYDSAVVSAETEEDARLINPDGNWDEERWYGAWAKTPTAVNVEYLGEARKGQESGIVLASFNAG